MAVTCLFLIDVFCKDYNNGHISVEWPLRDIMLDFAFASHQEVCAELGLRLKRQRLAQALTQKDLAERAGIALGTVKNVEGKGVSSLESIIRIVMALGLVDELATLFELPVTQSIALMERAQLAERKRAPGKTRLTKKP